MRRDDFQPGDPPWQEHLDNTFARPASWGPGPRWIYQVLLKRLTDFVRWARKAAAGLQDLIATVSVRFAVACSQRHPAQATSMRARR